MFFTVSSCFVKWDFVWRGWVEEVREDFHGSANAFYHCLAHTSLLVSYLPCSSPLFLFQKDAHMRTVLEIQLLSYVRQIFIELFNFCSGQRRWRCYFNNEQTGDPAMSRASICRVRNHCNKSLWLCRSFCLRWLCWTRRLRIVGLCSETVYMKEHE